MSNNSTIAIVTALQDGGSFYMRGGHLTVTNRSKAVNSTSAGCGAFLSIIQGTATVSGDSRIAHSGVSPGTSQQLEGTVAVSGGTVTIANSTIANSETIYGGAIFMDGGTLTIRESLIVNSTAQEGSGIFMIGGSAQITGSRISRTNALSTTAGSCLKLSGGDLRLIYSVIERSSSKSVSAGAILHVPSVSTGVGPLFIATFSEFQQHECNGPIFSQQGEARLILRNITITPILPECNTVSLASPSAFPGFEAKGCGTKYTDRQQQTWGVCNSDSPDACSTQSVVGTPLESLHCRCPFPEFANPDLAADFAPYQEVGGCIAPMRLTDMTVISRRVAVALTKPPVVPHDDWQLVKSVNVTLGEGALNQNIVDSELGPPLLIVCLCACSVEPR
eukprot:1086531-Prymnesium_polylepis.1